MTLLMASASFSGMAPGPRILQVCAQIDQGLTALTHIASGILKQGLRIAPPEGPTFSVHKYLRHLALCSPRYGIYVWQRCLFRRREL